MAKITARYASTCPACSQRIPIGASVEWTKGSPARHADCASDRPTARRPRTRTAYSSAPGLGARQSAPREPKAGEVAVYRDSSPYLIGQTVLVDRATWQTVTACGQYRISQYEDDCREGETRYWAHVRPATEPEALAAQTAREAREAAKTAATAARAILDGGEGMGRAWRQPEGTMTIARDPGRPGSLASYPYLVAAPDGTVYTIAPVYDDDPRVCRLAITVEQAQEAARLAGWRAC